MRKWEQQRNAPLDHEVDEDFRGRVYPAEPDTDSVNVRIETAEDFTGRVRTVERFPVTER